MLTPTRSLRTALFSLMSTLVPLLGQAEPQLATRTDLLDVYVKNTGMPEMVAIFDFTTPSRGVFEASQYLTGKTRGSFIGANQGRTSTYQAVFTPATLGKDYGVVFGLRQNATVTPDEAGNGGIGVSNAEVRMWIWPQTLTVFKDSSNTEVVGVPWHFDGTSSYMVTWDTNAATTLAKITHVRFAIQSGTGNRAIVRTIDLPCPSRLFDSPHAADANYPRRAPETSGIRNFSRNATDAILYDPWSESNPINTATASLTAGSNTDTIIGNFFYSYDYLSWIYGSKEVRNSNSSGWSAAPSDTGTLYGTESGYAVAAYNENVYTDKVSGVVAGKGWYNGLPVMTRYQAMKATSINVLLDYDGKINWIYRFLDPSETTMTGHEEGGTGTAAPTGDPNNSAFNGTELRFLRKLTSVDLATNTTSLQKLGPSSWVPTTTQTMSAYDFGAFANYDPRSPQPWGYPLANTYYRTAVERDSTVFQSLSAVCPGRTYVVAFPSQGMNDSKTNPLDQATADAYLDYGNGNTGLGKGSYTNLPGITSLIPGSEGFNPGILSSMAAFGTAAANNNNYWGAPWMINPAGGARSSSNPGLQTMVVSVGIPGSYKLQSDNNGRNPHERYFRMAQWANPYRTDLGYGVWRRANGNPDDDPITAGGKVHYYPSSDPSELEKNFRDLVAYIVAGSAALSAPATPSTGARITTQAYFGIFNTSRTPVWGGNLFAVGIKRALVTTGSVQQEVFTFYDAQGRDTRPEITDVNGVIIGYGISDFDNRHLWSAYDIFGNYVSSEIPLLKPVYTNGVLGSPLTWNSRTIYTIAPDGTQTTYRSDNTSLVNALATQFADAGLFAAALNTDALRRAEVQAFIDYMRGRNPVDATRNRINTMGDIINSAPLAIELSRNRLDSTGRGNWDAAASGALFGATSSRQDVHARMIVVGTNMGMVHGFLEFASQDRTTLLYQAKATEAWAFVPPDFHNLMYQVYKNRAAQDTFKHPYMVDGDPVLFWQDKAASGQLRGDTRVSSGEDGVVIFGMRKGGRSYYGLAISLSGDTSATPTTPKLLWGLRPDQSTDGAIRTMGMSTAVPAFAFVDKGTAKGKPVVFLSGGYSNSEMDRRFMQKDIDEGTTYYQKRMGRLVVCLDPIATTNPVLKIWDFRDLTDSSGNALLIGAIAGGVTPVSMSSTSLLTHRVYFADSRGNVMALNQSTPDAGTFTGFRTDSADIDAWRTTPRFIYRAATDTSYSGILPRFTNRPDAFRLSGNYPIPTTYSESGNTYSVKPVTVMVSIGSGDRNNPTDASESYTVGGVTRNPGIPNDNRLFVFADRQDSAALGWDADGIPGGKLGKIKDDNQGNTAWPTSYSDSLFNPLKSDGTENENYLWRAYAGYYFSLGTGTFSSALTGITYDKVLVSPLAKNGALFFSIFNINKNTGFDCSANAFTRTFRQCDIMKPLRVNTQVEASSTVGDTNDLNRNSDSCTGLAFYFNSLSSQLVDTGDRVVQGGAVASKSDSFHQQTGANTPDIKTVRDTDKRRGFKLRAWRVVR